MNKEELYIAIEALQHAAPVKVKWKEPAKPMNKGNGTLLLDTGKQKYTFVGELKKELRTVHITMLAALKELHKNLIVIAQVIYPNIGKQLHLVKYPHSSKTKPSS